MPIALVLFGLVLISCSGGDGAKSGGDDSTAGPWTCQFGSSAADSARAVAADRLGNVVVAGDTYGSLSDGSSGTSNVSSPFVAKIDRAGKLLWTREFGSGESSYVKAAGSDANGNLLAAGNTERSRPGAIVGEPFVVKYDSSGKLLWSQQVGSGTSSYAQTASIDAESNVLVGGTTEGALAGQTSAGVGDAFVVKYDPAGNLLWSRQFGSDGSEGVVAMSTDANASVVVAGSTTGALPGQTTTGNSDGFVAKLDSEGGVLWTRQMGTDGEDEARGVGTDTEGNIFVAGNTQGTLPGQESKGLQDVFVSKLDANGEVLWTRQFGSSDQDLVLGASTDPNGNFVVTWARITLAEDLSSSFWVHTWSKLDPDGDILGDREFGRTIDTVFATSMNAQGSLLVAGSTGSNDAFVSKLIW